MVMNYIYYLFCLITLIAALITVLSKQLVRAVFMFFLTLFCLAGLYLFSLADFIALTHIVVYVGGVLVLMIFGIMLSDKTMLDTMILHQETKNTKTLRWGAAIVVLLFFGVMLFLWNLVPLDQFYWMQTPNEDETHSIKRIGLELMTRFLLPFELISIFLLMALIGVAHISRKESTNA